MTYHDLSREISDGMAVYPGSPGVRIETTRSFSTDEDGVVDGGQVKAMHLANHDGTHVDAPSHMLPDGRYLEDYDLSTFAFDALRVDCTGAGAREPIPREALPAPTDHDLLVIHTGWEDHWGTDRYPEHPHLSVEAATYCVEHGYHVGLDTFSPDPIPAVDPHSEAFVERKRFPAHDVLLRGDRLILENLCNLAAPPEEFTLFAFPLALADGDGSPVRAVARAD